MNAFRSLLRLAWRSVIRNKQRSLLVIALIAVLVGAGTFVSVAARTTIPSDDDYAASRFGQGDVMVSLESQLYVDNPYGRYGGYLPLYGDLERTVREDPNYDTVEDWNLAVQAARQADREWIESFDHLAFADELRDRFGADVVTSRVGPPGSELGWAAGSWGSLSDIDLGDPLAEGILTLVSGRLPATGREVVVTDPPGSPEPRELGTVVVIGDHEFTVVGIIVEPTSKWTSAAVTTPAGFDRVIDETADRSYRYRLAVPADADPVEVFMQRSELTELAGRADLPAPDFSARAGLYVDLRVPPAEIGRGPTFDPGRSPVLLSTGLTALAGIQIALVAMSAFTVGVRRRTVEFGQLLTTGADGKQIRTLVLIESLVLGVTGAIVGAALGAGALWWVAEQGWLIELSDRYAPNVRWNPIDWAGPAIVGIAAAVLAAWWPARAVSKMPVVAALAGRLPTSRPLPRHSIRGLIAVAVGTVMVMVSVRKVSESFYGDGARALYFVALAMGFGLMFVGTLALIGQVISFVGSRADALALTARLIARNSDRQRSRAWAAVAAFIVIIGVPVMVAIALESYPNDVPNENQIVLNDWPLHSLQHSFGDGSAVPPGLVPIAQPIADERALPFDGPPAAAVAVGSGASEGSGDEAGRGEPAEPLDFETAVVSFADLVTTADEAANEVIDVAASVPILRSAEMMGWAIEESPYGVSRYPLDVAVATPELLAALEIDVAAAAALDDESALWVGNGDAPLTLTVTARRDTPAQDGVRSEVASRVIDRRGAMRAWAGPQVLVTEAVAESFGAPLYELGRLIVAADPIPLDSQKALYAAFADAQSDRVWLNSNGHHRDIGVESATLTDSEIRLVVIGGALAVALLIAVITAALAAVEVDREIGSMVASGAAPSMRRWLLGAQTMYHLAIAAVLAVPLSVLIFWAIERAGSNAGARFAVPWATITGVGVGIPLVAGLLIGLLFRSGTPAVSRRLG